MSPTTVPESLPLHPLKLYTIPKSDVEAHTRYRSGSQSSENDPVIEPHQYLQGHEVRVRIEIYCVDWLSPKARLTLFYV